MIFAAIWYIEDQDAPSEPFVLELDVGSGTREEIVVALLAYTKQHWGKSEEPEDDPEPELMDNMFGEYTIGAIGSYLIASSQGWGSTT